MSEEIKYPEPCDFLDSGILYFRTIWRKEGPEIYRRELMFLQPGTKHDKVTIAECGFENKWENKINFGGHFECATDLSGYTGSGDKLTFVKVTDTDLIRVFKDWECGSEYVTKPQSIQNLFKSLDKKDYGLRREEHQRILAAHSYSMMSDIDLRMLELWD